MKMRKVYFYNMYIPIRIKETSEYSIENDWVGKQQVLFNQHIMILWKKHRTIEVQI